MIRSKDVRNSPPCPVLPQTRVKYTQTGSTFRQRPIVQEANDCIITEHAVGGIGRYSTDFGVDYYHYYYYLIPAGM